MARSVLCFTADEVARNGAPLAISNRQNLKPQEFTLAEVALPRSRPGSVSPPPPAQLSAISSPPSALLAGRRRTPPAQSSLFRSDSLCGFRKLRAHCQSPA